ncbi:uncharacterized protein LOC127284398 [Leptopilina boulardi]|uniref:uncharacterized protein LOC127284398 n=1 Tax=Leptopilina boulardi TaxID=63433 RepID=UPI0021F69D11|nr:uncharacterized protein LOC127284398 [Leptopilina boulardi]
MMPNIGGPREKKRRLVATVIQSKQLYAAPERWDGESKGRWTYRLIPLLATWLDRKHGEVGYYLTQAFSGHGCFGQYFYRLKIEAEARCVYCNGSGVDKAIHTDDAEHTLFFCGHWRELRQAKFSAVGTEVTSENMVSIMLQSADSWRSVKSFITTVMRTKEDDRRR